MIAYTLWRGRLPCGEKRAIMPCMNRGDDMRKILVLAGFVLAMALMGTAALAEPAAEMTQGCVIRTKDNKVLRSLQDGDYTSMWSAYGDMARLTVTALDEERIHGVYVQFYNYSCAFDVQVKDADRKWQTVASCDGAYLSGYAALPEGVQEIRIRPQSNADRLSIAEVHVFGAGDVPKWVQQWEPAHEKADLLLISAHPDDEILFMGGTIPYYAGEKQKAVQVAYLVPATPYRKLELLDGLWLCGVRNYPEIGNFPDYFSSSIRGMYQKDGWSESQVLDYITWLYRRYRPDVVLTHDTNGEYGHGAHKVAADIAQKAIVTAADEGYRFKKEKALPVWSIKKLYLHLFEQGKIRMDWRVPLAAFDGKTAFEMAEAAFQCHVSQLNTEYKVEDCGPYDNSVFGLAYTDVGEDVSKNDFFEHIGM